MTITAQHTPTPWKAELHRNGGATIRQVGDDAKNERGAIATLTFGPRALVRADADFIVRAVNAHDDLLTALSSARAWVDSMPNQALANQCRDSDWYHAACTAIRTATGRIA